MRISFRLSLVTTLIGGIFLPLLSASSHFSRPQISLNDTDTHFNPPQSATANPTQWFAARSATDHQNDLNSLPANGWRLVSLSVYGTPPLHLYATVWVQKPGPLQKSTLAIGSSAFNDWYFFWTGQGYVPTVTTATGSQASGYIYAAVLEKISVLSWTAIWDETPAGFDTAVRDAISIQNQKMVSIDKYGLPTDQRFCAVLHHNPNSDGFWYFTSQNLNAARQMLRVQATKPYWRPICLVPFGLTGGTGISVSSIYTDTYVGAWTAQIFRNAAQVSVEDVAQRSQGKQLVRLQGGYPSFFNAIWAERDSPSPREFHVTGPPATGFKDNPSAVATVDGIFKSFMQATGLHEAQVAIGKGGVILLERAYTWSEPGRHIIQTADKFQLASLSKMFCAAAIQSLIDAGQLSLTTRPWFDFGSRAPWGPLAPGNRYLDITIEHLLNHQGGWDRRISSDWEFRMIEISNTFGLSGPPTLSEFIAYIGFYVRLDFDPGTATEYSNVGYMALSQVVETVTGMTYMEYVKSALLVPLGLGNSVGLFGTDPSLHVNDPVTPQSTFWGPNVQTPQDPTNLIASVFGGDGAYKETALGASNIICSAATLVKFMNRHAVWGNGPRCNHPTVFPDHGCWRDGVQNGSRTWAESRPDEIDWAVFLNTRQFPGGDQNFVNMLVSGGISAFLDTDPTL